MSERFDIELLGGCADGQVHTVSALTSYFNVLPLGVPLPETYRPGDAPEPVTPEVVTYTLELNAASGQPRRTGEGRYIYRHGPRPEHPAGLPDAIADRCSRAHSWTRRGPDRWVGIEPAHGGHFEHLIYIMAKTQDGVTVYAGTRVTFEYVALHTDVERVLWRDLEHDCDHQLLPECVTPGCRQRGRMQVTAAASGRFASRQWQAGESIRLCPEHYGDVIRAQHMTDVAELPSWLRVDASDLPDWWNHEVYCWEAGTVLPFAELRDPYRRRP